MPQTKEMKTAENKIEAIGKKLLIGLKVTDVRYMMDEEVEEMGWNYKAIVIHFSDGTIIYCSADDEGNDAGSLFYQTPKKDKDFNLGVIPVI